MNEVAKRITEEIKDRGVISFARFMDLALYCPEFGYYEREKDTPGRGGDYYTSVSVGSLFGELLALHFAGWLTEAPGAKPRGRPRAARSACQIVEAGAHDGRLAGDILGFLRQRRPELFEAVEYWIVEPSERRRAWQARRLEEFGRKVRWVRQMRDLDGKVRGVIFSNELLDAMPVQRFAWNSGRRCWFEWGVGLQGEQFVWQKMPHERMAPPVSKAWNKLLRALPDGFILDLGSAAEPWWLEAVNALQAGRVMTIDYGLTEEEFFIPERVEGTLRAYSQHRQCADVLAQPGAQDITAHVNFSCLRRTGESAGLKTEIFTTQERFLIEAAARDWQENGGVGKWTLGKMGQFRTLTHPQFLGRQFRVLVQRRPAAPQVRS